MYSLNITVPALRTKMRQEFERHRYVNQIQVVDTLLFQSHAEYQVRAPFCLRPGMKLDGQNEWCEQRGDRQFTGHNSHFDGIVIL